MLKELEAEQQELQEENKHVKQTIETMMNEMQKLNIGAANTVEPMLDEGPLDFVGRFWEKVRPRDTAVVVNEHVGEINIKRSTDGADGSSPSNRPPPPPPQEIGKQVVQKLSGAFGPLWQRAEGLISQTQSHFADAGAQKAKKRPGEKKRKERQAGSSESSTAPPAETSEQASSSTTAADSANASATPEATGPAVTETPAAQEAPTTEASKQPASAPAASPPAASTPVAPQEASPQKMSLKPVGGGGGGEEIKSTILIDAMLTLDDGSKQALQVFAADRCKEVARKFVQEHSLKVWFVDPLTLWLKSVEADAETFPVKAEGDILEIRNKFSKK